MKNPFRSQYMRAIFDHAVAYAQQGKYGTPAAPVRGAGHRCAFWDGYAGRPNLKWPKDSVAYVYFRAGQACKHDNVWGK